MNSLEQFSKMKYLNLETFRKAVRACRRRSGLSSLAKASTFRPMANSGKVNASGIMAGST